MSIEGKLIALGFIVKNRLKQGLNRAPTVAHPNKKNGWFYINKKTVKYGSCDESIKPGWFWINDNSNSFKLRAEYIQARKLHNMERERLETQEAAKKIQVIKIRYKLFNQPCITHKYLVDKKSLTHKLFKLDDKGRLIIPAFNIERRIVGYQVINSEGDKAFGIGSVIKNAFFPIISGKLKDQKILLLAEGYATASSIFQAVNLPVITCFTASNVDNVAGVLRSEVCCPIVAIKDNDTAGHNIKCLSFTVGKAGEDANDVHINSGLKKLNEVITSQLRGFLK